MRQAFSQAYRPQANGRAEVAGRTVRNVLRKLNADRQINWVEALPRALRIRHDLPDPRTGLSPYQLVFGRERPLAGLPYSTAQENADALEYLDHREKLDKAVAETIREELRKEEERINSTRKEVEPFSIGQWVWVYRPTAYSGVKMQTMWMGPYSILRQEGEDTYVVAVGPRRELQVHVDQIKPAFSHPSTRIAYPMVYRKGEPPFFAMESHIRKILDVRDSDDGLELKVDWEGEEGNETTWVSVKRLGGAIAQAVEVMREFQQAPREETPPLEV